MVPAAFWTQAVSGYRQMLRLRTLRPGILVVMQPACTAALSTALSHPSLLHGMSLLARSVDLSDGPGRNSGMGWLVRVCRWGRTVLIRGAVVLDERPEPVGATPVDESSVNCHGSGPLADEGDVGAVHRWWAYQRPGARREQPLLPVRCDCHGGLHFRGGLLPTARGIHGEPVQRWTPPRGPRGCRAGL